MNDFIQPTRADALQSGPQAIKPARWKELPGGTSFAAVLNGEIKKEKPKASEEPRPPSDERDREETPAQARSDQAASATPIGGVATPPAQPVEPPRTGSSQDQSSQPTPGVTNSTAVADGAVVAAGSGTAAGIPAADPALTLTAGMLAGSAVQTAAAAVTASQGAAAPQTAQDPAAVPLQPAKKDTAEISAGADAADAVPAPISPAAAREPNVPKRVSLDDLQIPVAVQPAAQAKAKQVDPAVSAKGASETAAAQVQPAGVDPASARAAQSAIEGARLTPASVTTFEPARLTEAQNQDLISQVVNNVETLVKTRQTTLHLMLNPEELGRIDLRLTSSSAGMGVSLVAHQSGTSQLLESQVAQLRQALDQAGIHLTNLSVGQQSSQSSTGQNSQRPHSQVLHRQAVLAAEPAVEERSAVANRSSSAGYDYRI
jgi:flagellar hook-length control protein FliK